MCSQLQQAGHIKRSGFPYKKCGICEEYTEANLQFAAAPFTDLVTCTFLTQPKVAGQKRSFLPLVQLMHLKALWFPCQNDFNVLPWKWITGTLLPWKTLTTGLSDQDGIVKWSNITRKT